MGSCSLIARLAEFRAAVDAQSTLLKRIQEPPEEGRRVAEEENGERSA